MTMAMVTARVNAERKRDAEKVLKRNGRTYSDLIRDLTDYFADTGELPEFERLTLSLIQERERRKKQELIQRFADRNLPEAELNEVIAVKHYGEEPAQTSLTAALSTILTVGSGRAWASARGERAHDVRNVQNVHTGIKEDGRGADYGIGFLADCGTGQPRQKI